MCVSFLKLFPPGIAKATSPAATCCVIPTSPVCLPSPLQCHLWAFQRLSFCLCLLFIGIEPPPSLLCWLIHTMLGYFLNNLRFSISGFDLFSVLLLYLPSPQTATGFMKTQTCAGFFQLAGLDLYLDFFFVLLLLFFYVILIWTQDLYQARQALYHQI